MIRNIVMLLSGSLCGLACAGTLAVAAEPVESGRSCSSGERKWAAELLRVVDGDTYDLRIDLGLEVQKIERIRLIGVDTPEIRGEEKDAGLAAKIAAEEFFTGCPCNVISTGSRGKYGRLLADVENASGHLISDFLRASGHSKG